MSLDVMDLWHVLFFTLWVVFSAAHLYYKSQLSSQKKRTQEPWLVAVHLFMTPPDMLRVALFGCYSSFIFSKRVMSPVLDFDKSKASGVNASLMEIYNDRPGTESRSPRHLSSPLCKLNKSTWLIIVRLNGTSSDKVLIRRSGKETGRDLVKLRVRYSSAKIVYHCFHP